MDLQQYWKDRRAIQNGLPEGDVFLVSIENPRRGWTGGIVTEVSREIAARDIAEGSHRIATPEEVEAYRIDQQRRAERQRANAREAAGVSIFTLPAARGRKP
jgi:hypothetical protein